MIPADNEEHAVEIANDTIYGLNNSVFTNDADRAYDVARQLRSGTVGHNSFRTDFGIAFGGFKQSGIGREGGREGLLPYLEAKTIILDEEPAQVRLGSVVVMDHVRLGRTGLQVSRLCLGTMTFGLQCDEPTSVSILDLAAEGGIDFIDSSDVYPLGGDLTTQGRTEEILGRWLSGKRDRFVLATKCFGRTGPSPLDSGNSRRHIFAGVEASLRRLQTDYIDLYSFTDTTPPPRSTRRSVHSTISSTRARQRTAVGARHRRAAQPDRAR